MLPDDKEADVRGRGLWHDCVAKETDRQSRRIITAILLVKTAEHEEAMKGPTKFCHDRHGIEKVNSK